MNTNELLAAFITAGLDTPAKVVAALADLARQSELKRIDLELEGLNAKRLEAMKPLEDARIELTNRRAELAAQVVG